MDQRRSDVAQDVRHILETRNAISQKIEVLERRIQETVEGTRTTVEEMVDRVKDVADDFVDRTKQTFDPTYQVHQHPWGMVGGAILVGYVLGIMESRMASRSRPSDVYPSYPPDAEQAGVSVIPPRGRWQQANIWQEVSQEISREIEHAKHAAIEVGRTFVKDFFEQALPALGQSFFGRRSYRPDGSSRKSGGNGSEFTRNI
jgi:ElaB/YqjD/DUF883 family membrane-anchored ribosome-binding protein